MKPKPIMGIADAVNKVRNAIILGRGIFPLVLLRIALGAAGRLNNCRSRSVVEDAVECCAFATFFFCEAVDDVDMDDAGVKSW